MKSLPNLFKIMELMRAQTQYGYALSGIPRNQISGLGDHHYLVTFIGWQLATSLKRAGVNIDVLRVIEYCLIHDIGELMGGDISAHYGSFNKKARKLAKAFEEENQRYISKFFGEDCNRVKKLAKDILDAKSDEALIAKVADYVECTNYKVYVGHYKPDDKVFNKLKISEFINKMKDKTAKKLLNEYLSNWLRTVEDDNYIGILKNG